MKSRDNDIALHKDPKAYKGFEISLHAAQMALKMHMLIFVGLGLAHLILYWLLAWAFVPRVVGGLTGYIMSSLGAFSLPDISRVAGYVGALLSRTWPIVLLSGAVWFAYPAILVVAKKRSEGMMADQHIRGSKQVTAAELTAQLEAEHKTDESCIPIGSIRLPREYEQQHAFIAGRAGSGKTTLIYQIVQKIRERAGKAIIQDMKGDYIPMFYDPDKDLIFNAADQRSIKWSVLNEIRSLPDIESFCNSLIPPALSQSSNDRYWIDAARDILFSIIYYLVRKGKTTNEDLWNMVKLSEGQLLHLMQAAVAEGYEPCNKALGYLLGEEKGSRVAADTVATMKQFTNCFLYLRDSDGPFCLRDWVGDGKDGFLFVANYRNLKDVLKPVLSLMIDLASKYTLSLQDDYNRRIWYVLDEFPQLQRTPAVIELLEAGRSKGASVWISTQDHNQLQALYGREKSNSLINNCNTTIAFALGDPESQDYLSKLFGDQEILETDESLSMGPEDLRDGLSINRKRKVERVLLPAEFGAVAKFHFYIKVLHHDVALDRVWRKDIERKHPALVEKTNLGVAPDPPPADTEAEDDDIKI